MDFTSQLGNSIAYSLHQATYNPDAEEFSKKRAEQEQKAVADKQKQEQVSKEAVEAQKAAAAAKVVAATEEERKTFSILRMMGRILKYVLYATLGLVCIYAILLGASYSVNLNIYRPWSQRIFYAIYGSIFFIPVVLYNVVYRRWMKGHTNPTYGFLPLFETEEASSFVKTVMPFLTFTYSPDMENLKEWESTKAKVPNTETDTNTNAQR